MRRWRRDGPETRRSRACSQTGIGASRERASEKERGKARARKEGQNSIAAHLITWKNCDGSRYSSSFVLRCPSLSAVVHVFDVCACLSACVNTLCVILMRQPFGAGKSRSSSATAEREWEKGLNHWERRCMKQLFFASSWTCR